MTLALHTHTQGTALGSLLAVRVVDTTYTCKEHTVRPLEEKQAKKRNQLSSLQAGR